MAGNRLYSEFKNDNGDVYRVSIYDTNAAWNPASASTFKLGSDGFTLSYSGNNEQQHQPIIPSTVEFTLYEETSAHTQTLDLMFSFPEGRLLLEIYSDPDGDNDIYWRGVILAEQVERSDEPFPTAVRITASDDLGNLRDIDFTRTVLAAGTTVLDDITRCLLRLRTAELWASTEPFIRYINDTELYAASDDTNPLDTIALSVPLKMASDGTSTPHNCYDILSSLATCFNARIFQVKGVFYFWPINIHQRVSDAEAIGSVVKQADIDSASVAWSAADIIAFNTEYKPVSGTNYNKLAGHTFTHLPPAESITRTRRANGNMYIVSGDDDTIVTSGVNITLADDDRTYDSGTKFQVGGQVLFNVSPDAAFDFGLPESRVHVELEISLNVGTRYYTPEQWTGVTTDKYVIDMASFDRSNGCNINTMYSFITEELPSDQDDLDLTAVVKFFNEEGTNVTSSYTSEDFYLFLSVQYVDGDTGNPDTIVFRADGNSENTLVIEQGELLHGDRDSFSAQGYFIDTSNQWKSTQTTGPISLHRLGVNEALSRQRYATKIHRGNVYGRIEMWMTMVEDSDYYVPFEMSYNANMHETTVERYKIAWDSSGITSADDEVRRESNRGDVIDFVNATANTVTSLVQQPKPTAGEFPIAIGGRALQQSTNVGPLFHRVTLIEHSGGATHTIETEHQTYIYMNTYVDTANGTGNILLPRVAENEGRMYRFKSDGTIGATKNYRIGLSSDEQTAGVRIDGQTTFTMNRDYDGIAVLCYDGQWYVIQRKQK